MIDTTALMPTRVRDDAVDLHIMYDILNPMDIDAHELDWSRERKLKEYLDGLPTEVDWMVFHNGIEIDPTEKADITLEPNDRISLAVIPQGGGGVKSILRALVTVAFVVVGSIIGGPLGAAIGGALAGLVNAFLLTPKPKVSDNESETTYGIDGAKNSAVENIPYPVVYGQFRQAGNFCDVYTENVGDTQYLYIRSIMADGLIESIDDIEINEQEASNYDNVSIRKTLGELNPTVNSWFQNTIRMQNKNIKLDTSWTEHQTTDEVDRVRFDVMFPKGLVDIDEKKGKYRSKSVTFEVQHRLTGGTTWDALNTDVEETTVYDDVPAVIQVPNTEGLQVGVRIPIADLEAASDTDEVEVNLGPIGTVTKTVRRNVKEILAESQATQTVTSNDYGNTRYANWNVYEPDLGFDDWEVSTNYGGIDRSVAFQSGGSFSVSDNRTAQIRRSFYTRNLPKGNYEVRIRRTSTTSTSEYILDEAFLTDIAEIEDDPVSVSGRATLSIRVKLTDQLNAIPTLTALVTGSKVQKYDIEGNPVGAPVYSNRPAWCWADILMSDSRGAQLPPEEVDFPALLEWAEHCETEDLQYNGIFSSTGNVYDALVEVCSAGDAAPINLGTKNSVVIDRPRDPVQGFNSANMISGSFAVTYLPQSDRANEFEVTYYDKEDRNKEKALRYVDPKAVLFSETPRAVSVPLRGIDNKEAAAKELWKMIYANRLLIRSVTFDAYTDVLSASLGDVILIQSNQMEWSQGGFAGIGSTTTDIVLDQEVPFEGGTTYGLILQHDALKISDVTVSSKVGNKLLVTGDAALHSKDIHRIIVNGEDYAVLRIDDGATYQTIYVDGDITAITASDNVECWRTDVMEERVVTAHTVTGGVSVVTVNAAYSKAPVFGNRFIYGETTKVNQPYTIQSITGSGVERRTVSAVEYNEAVYDPAEVDVAIPIEQISTRAVTQVSDIRVDFDLASRINQQAVNVHILWNSGNTRNYTGADVYARINGADYRPIGTAWNVSQFHFTANQGDELEIKVVAFNDRMDRAPINSAPSTTATITGTVVAEDGIPINYIPSNPLDPVVPIEDLRPAEAGATEGAPAGTSVNGVPVETITTDIDDAKQDVADLFTTYGNTASSAASAAAAEAAKQGAETAETATEIFRDAAAVAQSASETARDQAAVHATTASTKATEASDDAASASADASLAAGYRDEAEQEAAAALVSSQSATADAATATTKATEASASAVSSSADAGTATSAAATATTKATEATVAAASASASESLSAAYSLDSLVRAGRSAFIVGGSFSNSDQFFLTTNVNQAEDSTGVEAGAAPGATQVQDVDEGSVLELTIGSLGSRLLISRNRFPIVDDADKTYRLKFRYKIQSDGSSATRKFRYGIQVHRTDNGNYGGVAGFFQTVQASAADGWQEATWEVDGATLVAHGNGSPNREIRPHVRFTDFTDNTTSTTVVRLSQLQIQDVTAEKEAEKSAISASAALVSEQSAAADSSSASTSESNAASSAATANTAAGTATAQASIATAQATTATAQAVAASASTELAARIANNSLITDPTFADFPTATGAAPTQWNNGPVGAAGLSREESSTGGYGVRMLSSGGSEYYIRQLRRWGPRLLTGDSYYVVEADFTLNSGSLVGSGVLLRSFNQSNASFYDHTVKFANEIPNPVAGGRYSVSKLIDMSVDADAYYFDLYPMGAWTGLGSISAARDITFWKCSVRPATQTEIEAGTALPALESSVAVNQAAIATIEGAAAYYETVVAASGSTPAKVRLTAGASGSAVNLIAESITIENPVDGALVEVARFEDGKARLNNAVIRGLSVLPRSDSEIAMPVLLEPLQFLATDGDIVQYQGGDTFGAVPSRIVPDLSGLPTPPSGNSYDVRAVNITATQFEVVAEEISAPSNTTQTAGNGTNVGGTPQYRSNKPSSANAYNDQYQFFFSGTIPRTFFEFEPTGGGMIQYWAEYQGSFDIYVSNSASSNVLTKVATVTVSASQSGTAPSSASIPSSSSFSTSRVINTAIAIGQHGSYEFGMHPVGSATMTGFTNVQYTTQTSSGSTALTDLIPWSVYQPAAD